MDERNIMNLVFIGASAFGLRCLDICFQLPEVNVVGVVTAPQTFAITYRPTGVTNVLHADVVALTKSLNIPVRSMNRSMNETGLFEVVTQWKPDAFLVAGWYHMIPKNWRKLAPAYGLHASLLPDYSGGAPLVWSLINGEAKTGITLFKMDDGVDSGPIAGQREEPIYSNDTIQTLYSRIEQSGVELVREILPLIAKGTVGLQPQDESKRRIMPQRGPEDGLIDWDNDSVFIDRFIRAQTRPYPGAFSIFNGKPLHIWQGRACKPASDAAAVGQVRKRSGDIYHVNCGRGAIQLNEISYEQKTYNQQELSQLFGGGGKCWAYSRAA